MDKITVTLTEAAPRQTSAGASGMAYQAGDQVTAWQEDGTWFYCYHGVTTDGNYYEADNIESEFHTQGLVLCDAIAAYHGYELS